MTDKEFLIMFERIYTKAQEENKTASGYYGSPDLWDFIKWVRLKLEYDLKNKENL